MDPVPPFVVGGLIVTNRASVACWLVGRPVISFRGGSRNEAFVERPLTDTGTIVVRFTGTATKPTPSERPRNAVLLDPGATAGDTFTWWNWCRPPRPDRVVVTLASSTTPLATRLAGGVLHVPPCADPLAASVLSVSLWSVTP